jgi:hypothetical protein
VCRVLQGDLLAEGDRRRRSLVGEELGLGCFLRRSRSCIAFGASSALLLLSSASSAKPPSEGPRDLVGRGFVRVEENEDADEVSQDDGRDPDLFFGKGGRVGREREGVER